MRIGQGLAVGLLVAMAACGSDSSGVSGTPQDFTGTYTLVSFAQGTPSGIVPGATGGVTFTSTTYVLSVVIPGVITLDDAGTYTATGTATEGSWTQESSEPGGLQSSGTYEWDEVGQLLTLDTRVSGVRTIIVLHKE